MWALNFFELAKFCYMGQSMISAENLTLSSRKRHGDICDFSQAKRGAREDFVSYRADLTAQEAIRIASLYEEVKKELRLRKIVGVQNETLYGQEGGIGSKRVGLSDQDIQ